jgi:hypothetical protein
MLHKADQPVFIADFLHADFLACERLAEIDWSFMSAKGRPRTIAKPQNVSTDIEM